MQSGKRTEAAPNIPPGAAAARDGTSIAAYREYDFIRYWQRDFPSAMFVYGIQRRCLFSWRSIKIKTMSNETTTARLATESA
jgi:hypothetical protein